MSKHYPGPWVLRTLLFTPGHNEKLIGKAFQSAADCVVLDLEDAVPDHEKECARETIRSVIWTEARGHKTVFARINPLESGLTLLDLDSVACERLDGIVFPKAYCPDDIKALDAQLSLKERTLGLESGHFDIIILIETPQAVLCAYEMAIASDRVIGLLYGCEDFLTDMEGLHGPDGRSLLVPRHMVTMASRAAGIVPIDTPYVKVRDEDGFREHITQGRELGMEGILVMTPKQINIAREMYTPSDIEVAEAAKLVQLADSAREESRGIAVSDGVFVSPPTLKRARKVLARRRAIENFETYRSLDRVTVEAGHRLQLRQREAATLADPS